MQKINFLKMHGLGNDFVIIDKRRSKINITKKIINKLSDRKSGAGCDQLITINNGTTNNVDAKIEIFNPSGDKAEACGNGTRCVAKILFDELKKDKINILSDAGILYAEKKDGINISVNLGKLSTNWKDIPMLEEMNTLDVPIKIKNCSNGVAVNIGNPHIVFFGKDIDNINLHEIGPEIENHKFFPKKINVELIEILNNNKIKMRVWERGVGITLACGSGACASVYAGYIKKFLNNDVEVLLNRGSLFVKIENESAIMTGPAEISYAGYINI